MKKTQLCKELSYNSNTKSDIAQQFSQTLSGKLYIIQVVSECIRMMYVKICISIDTKKCATDMIEEISLIKLIQSMYLTTIYPEL